MEKKNNRLTYNTWVGVFNIINCVLFTLSWLVIFGTALSESFGLTDSYLVVRNFFYIMALVGAILNLISLILSKRNNISIVGAVLGLIGSLLFFLTAALAFPATVLLIISVVFLFLQHPSKNASEHTDLN